MKGNENTIKREFSAFKRIDDNTIIVTDVSDKVRIVDKKDKYMTLIIIKAYTLQTRYQWKSKSRKHHHLKITWYR